MLVDPCEADRSSAPTPHSVPPPGVSRATRAAPSPSSQLPAASLSSLTECSVTDHPSGQVVRLQAPAAPACRRRLSFRLETAGGLSNVNGALASQPCSSEPWRVFAEQVMRIMRMTCFRKELMDCVWVSGVAEAMRPLRVRVQEGDGRSGARGGSMLALARSGNELPAARRSISRRPTPQGTPSLPHRRGATGELARRSRVPMRECAPGGWGSKRREPLSTLSVFNEVLGIVGSGGEKSLTKRVDKGSRQKGEGGSASTGPVPFCPCRIPRSR